MPQAGTAVTAFIQVPSSSSATPCRPMPCNCSMASAVVFRYQRGTVQAVPVVVGQQSANRSEILQGVRSGDQLLSGNTAKLRDALAGPQQPDQN